MLPFLGSTQLENLVLNPSFEITINECAGNENGLNNFKGWFSLFKGNYHSPGGFNQCLNSSLSGNVPNNSSGYQFPRTGENYGFGDQYLLTHLTHCSEYPNCGDSLRAMEPLTGTLVNTLGLKKTYYFECYVSKCDNANTNNIATDAFDLVLHFDTLGFLHPYEPWIKQSDIVWSNPSGNIIRDTMNWVKLSGCFEAQGGEKFFSIGSFRSPELYHHEGLDLFPGTNRAAYYFDDFLIRECDTCCLDTNPVQDYIQLKGNPVVTGEPPVFEVFLNPGHTADIKVFDAAGRIVYESKIQSSGQHQMPYGLARAVYSYALINNEDEIYSGKFVVN